MAVGRLGSQLGLAAVAAVAIAVGLTLAHYGLRLWTHTYDEDIYKGAALRTTQHFPGALWDPHLSTRGLQRMESWVMAVGLGLFDTPAAFRVVRLINVALFCSTVVPVWLWARSLGIGRTLAAGAAILTILVPWATVTAVFFTENVAYPAVTWALYATWRAAARPGLWPLVLALVAVFVAALARSVMLLLAALLAITVVSVAVRCHGRAAWAARRTWTARQVAPWALFAAATVAAVAVYAFDRPAFSEQLTGSYQTGLLLGGHDLGTVSKVSVARVLSGIGILPGIVAVAWIGRALTRPAGPQQLALAVLAVLMTLSVIYSGVRGGPDERYLMYAAPILLLCAAVGVQRREAGPVGLLVAAALVVWLFASVPWSPDQHAYGFLVSSAQAFYARILVLGVGSHVPNVGLSYGAILAVAILVAAAAAAWALWRGGRAGLAVAAVLGLGVLGVQVAQFTYVERHFTREAAWGPDLDGRVWVDHAIGPDEHAALFMTNQNSNVVPLGESVREISFWNLKLDLTLLMPGTTVMFATGASVEGVHIDPATGHLISATSIPRHLVEPRLLPIAPLAGKTIAQAGYEPFALVDAGPSPRVQWQVLGVDDMAWSVPGQTTAIRIYRGPAADAGHCLDVGLTPPGELKGTRKVVVRSGSWRRTLTLKAGHNRALHAIPLTSAGANAFGDVRLTIAGVTKLADGRRTGVNVTTVARVACGAKA